jgi:adenylosuccinate synthase
MDGVKSTEVPFQMNRVVIEPELVSFPGWKTDTTSLKNYNNLPESMIAYIEFINNYLKVKINYISNGPGRDQLIENR